jgi:hypothetical protein
VLASDELRDVTRQAAKRDAARINQMPAMFHGFTLLTVRASLSHCHSIP